MKKSILVVFLTVIMLSIMPKTYADNSTGFDEEALEKAISDFNQTYKKYLTNESISNWANIYAEYFNSSFNSFCLSNGYDELDVKDIVFSKLKFLGINHIKKNTPLGFAAIIQNIEGTKKKAVYDGKNSAKLSKCEANLKYGESSYFCYNSDNNSSECLPL